MKVFLFIKRCIMRAFALSAIFSLFMYFVAAVSDYISDDLPPSQFLLLLLFAVVVAFAQEILFIRQLPLVARIAIHGSTILVSFLLIFTISGKIAANFGKIMVFAFIFLFIYALIVTITFLILRATGYYEKHMSCLNGSESKESETYTKRFN